MKKNDVMVGAEYVAKVSGKLARVRIERESPYGGWEAVNADTGRRVRIKSAQRLRRAVGNGPVPVSRGATAAAAPASEVEQTGPAVGEAVEPEQANDAGDVPGSEPIAEGSESFNPDVCATVGCGRPSALTYLGRPRCQECYEDDVTDGDLPDQQAGETSTETPNHEETEMAKAKKKTTRKSAKKATKTTKALKPDKGAKQQPKATKPKAARTPAAADKPKRASALDAAAQVLAKAGKPMRSQEMIVAMAEQGLWESPAGKTPHATLYAAILRELSAKGDAARFKKVDRGQFAFNAAGA